MRKKRPRTRQRSAGRVLFGLVAGFLGLLSLMPLMQYWTFSDGIEAKGVVLAGYTLVLAMGGIHALRTGAGGVPVPEEAATGSESVAGHLSTPLWITALAVAVFPLYLPVSVGWADGAHARARAPYSWRAAMSSDLRNLQSAQEIYYGDGHYTYAPALAALGLTESRGVHVTITGYGVDGHGATATHDELPGVTCAVYVGEAYRVEPATESGVVAC